MLEGSPSLLHVPNSDGEWDEISPLHIAAKYGPLDIVKELIDRGAEVYHGMEANQLRFHCDSTTTQNIK